MTSAYETGQVPPIQVHHRLRIAREWAGLEQGELAETDLGSGMNYRKKGLTQLLDAILDDRVGRLVITHKDRLLRFGAELVFAVCEAKNVEVVIINQGTDRTFEQELVEDVLEIVTVFSARLYGARSHKNKKLIDGVHKAVTDVQGT